MYLFLKKVFIIQNNVFFNNLIVNQGEEKLLETDKKQRILNSTLKLINLYGFHGTPISMIAKDAEVGAGTIYRYFKNKVAIFNELFSIIMKEFHEATISNIPEGVSVKDEFYIKYRNMLNYFVHNEYKGAFIAQYLASPFIKPEIIEENRTRNIHLHKLIARGISDNSIREVTYDTVALYMWGVIKQLHYLYTNNAIEITEEFIDTLFEFFWEGIRAK